MSTVLHELPGGESMIEKVADMLHMRVQQDQRISPHVQHLQKAHHHAFWNEIFGVERKHEEHERLVRQMAEHKELDSMLDHMATTLKEMGVSDEAVRDTVQAAQKVRKDLGAP